MKFKSAKYGGWFRPQTPSRYRGKTPKGNASIIVPFGSVDYLGPLSNCLRSIRWQEHVNPKNIEVLIVYLHKSCEVDRIDEMKFLDDLVRRYELTLIGIHKDYDHFPLCLGRNIGARAAKNETLFFVDADAVLDPEFVVRSLRNPDSLVTCWFSYLKPNHGPVDKKSFVRAMAQAGQVRRYAYGGGIVAPKSVVEEIRGFDEVYDRAWGADDNDMVDRLIEYGLPWYNLSARENIVNLHQYHPRRDHEKDPGTIANRRRYYGLNTVIRNNDEWGKP